MKWIALPSVGGPHRIHRGAEWNKKVAEEGLAPALLD